MDKNCFHSLGKLFSYYLSLIIKLLFVGNLIKKKLLLIKKQKKKKMKMIFKLSVHNKNIIKTSENRKKSMNEAETLKTLLRQLS
jgi:hypothetical protein